LYYIYQPIVITNIITTASTFVTVSDKSERDHVTGKSASLTLLVFHRQLSAQSGSVFRQVTFIAAVLF